MSFRLPATPKDPKVEEVVPVAGVDKVLSAAELPPPSLPALTPPSMMSLESDASSEEAPAKPKRSRKKVAKVEEVVEPVVEASDLAVEEVTTTPPTEEVQEPAHKLVLANGPFPIVFFGNSIQRFYYGKKWYFALSDLLQVPVYPEKQPRVENTVRYQELHPKISKPLTYMAGTELKEVVCLDYAGIAELMNLLQGTLPGPFSRWIKEVSEFEKP